MCPESLHFFPKFSADADGSPDILELILQKNCVSLRAIRHEYMVVPFAFIKMLKLHSQAKAGTQLSVFSSK